MLLIFSKLWKAFVDAYFRWFLIDFLLQILIILPQIFHFDLKFKLLVLVSRKFILQFHYFLNIRSRGLYDIIRTHLMYSIFWVLRGILGSILRLMNSRVGWVTYVQLLNCLQYWYRFLMFMFLLDLPYFIYSNLSIKSVSYFFICKLF